MAQCLNLIPGRYFISQSPEAEEALFSDCQAHIAPLRRRLVQKPIQNQRYNSSGISQLQTQLITLESASPSDGKQKYFIDCEAIIDPSKVLHNIGIEGNPLLLVTENGEYMLQYEGKDSLSTILPDEYKSLVNINLVEAASVHSSVAEDGGVNSQFAGAESTLYVSETMSETS